jgi:hypothetical protein
MSGGMPGQQRRFAGSLCGWQWTCRCGAGLVALLGFNANFGAQFGNQLRTMHARPVLNSSRES